MSSAEVKKGYGSISPTDVNLAQSENFPETFDHHAHFRPAVLGGQLPFTLRFRA